MANPKDINGLRWTVASATAVSTAVTCNADVFRITSESLTTAAAAEYTLTMTNKLINANSIVLLSVAKGTSTQGTLACWEVKPWAWSCVLTVTNTHATEALNGTIVIRWLVINATGV